MHKKNIVFFSFYYFDNISGLRDAISTMKINVFSFKRKLDRPRILDRRYLRFIHSVFYYFFKLESNGKLLYLNHNSRLSLKKKF